MTERMTPAGIMALWAKGMTNKEVGAVYGVTPQAVSDMSRRYGLTDRDPRKRATKAFPWRVQEAHKYASPNKRLRDHAEYYFSGGDGMTQDKLYRLYGFYTRLRDEELVIEYNPEFPPEYSSPEYKREPRRVQDGGWRWQPRKESDGDLIIRVNELTVPMDEETLDVWRFPMEMPQIRRT